MQRESPHTQLIATPKLYYFHTKAKYFSDTYLYLPIAPIYMHVQFPIIVYLHT